MARCQYNLFNARLQFFVGKPDSVKTNLPAGSYSLPDTGGSQIMFNLMVINDSIEVYSEGSNMPREVLDQVSYDVIFNTDQTLIDFFTGEGDPGLQYDQLIVVRLQYKTPA